MSGETAWVLYEVDGAAIVARSEADAVAGWRAMRWREGVAEGVHRAADIAPVSVSVVRPVAWVAGARL